MQYAQERLFPDLINEMRPLLQRHWREIAMADAFGPVDIADDVYRSAEDGGMTRVYTARRDDGALVGYAAYFVLPNMHYRTKLVAESDVFFLAPEERRGLAGLRLLQYADKALTAEGVAAIINKVKCSHDCGRLFARMGYTHFEDHYMRVVQHGD